MLRVGLMAVGNRSSRPMQSTPCLPQDCVVSESSVLTVARGSERNPVAVLSGDRLARRGFAGPHSWRSVGAVRCQRSALSGAPLRLWHWFRFPCKRLLIAGAVLVCEARDFGGVSVGSVFASFSCWASGLIFGTLVLDRGELWLSDVRFYAWCQLSLAVHWPILPTLFPVSLPNPELPMPSKSCHFLGV